MVITRALFLLSARLFFSSLLPLLSPLLLLLFLSRALSASCSFCSTGRHFLSTRANTDVICARSFALTIVIRFRFEGKEEKGGAREKQRERRRQRPEAAYGERASSRDEKDELKFERARAQRRMMIDRLCRGLEFDFSFRRRREYTPYTVSFLHSPLFFLSFSLYFARHLPSRPPRRVVKSTSIFRPPRAQGRSDTFVLAPGDFPDARVRSPPRKGVIRKKRRPAASRPRESSSKGSVSLRVVRGVTGQFFSPTRARVHSASWHGEPLLSRSILVPGSSARLFRSAARRD